MIKTCTAHRIIARTPDETIDRCDDESLDLFIAAHCDPFCPQYDNDDEIAQTTQPTLKGI